MRTEAFNFLITVNQADAYTTAKKFNIKSAESVRDRTTSSMKERISSGSNTIINESLQDRVSLHPTLEQNINTIAESFNVEDYTLSELGEIKQALESDQLGKKKEISVLKRIMSLFSKSVKNEIQSIKYANETISSELKKAHWEEKRDAILEKINRYQKKINDIEENMQALRPNDPIRGAFHAASKEEKVISHFHNILNELSNTEIYKGIPSTQETNTQHLQILGTLFVKSLEGITDSEKSASALVLVRSLIDASDKQPWQAISEFVIANASTPDFLYELLTLSPQTGEEERLFKSVHSAMGFINDLRAPY